MRSRRRPALCALVLASLFAAWAYMGAANGAELKIFGSRVSKIVARQ